MGKYQSRSSGGVLLASLSALAVTVKAPPACVINQNRPIEMNFDEVVPPPA